ncbi:MAG: hypothetical protein KGH67_01550 [Candidatus Micrarchaeota archaeon]|nr:hypothetical protein [Candidatus Micrarchaeota archaeon]MDE1859191.1 hypothetical protein [Candidatus Micrarchaeota archaeon]
MPTLQDEIDLEFEELYNKSEKTRKYLLQLSDPSYAEAVADLQRQMFITKARIVRRIGAIRFLSGSDEVSI